VGITRWQPLDMLFDSAANGNLMNIRQALLANWSQGLVYMGCVVGILLFHEMGHYVATLIYRIPATAPIFIPFPFNPIGTLGAVIGMQGMNADRKQIFDIGIAGPLAGLVVALPLALIGVAHLDLTTPGHGGLGLKMPLLLDWLIRWQALPGYENGTVWLSQLNPYFSAAWVGLLVTGLNMMPVGQLDGGHVTYTLLGKWAYPLAKLAIVLAIAFMVCFQHFVLVVMVTLLLIIGTEHPPTRDDQVPLGWFRTVLGYCSLIIPVVCFPPLVFEIAI
jgi:membrane-associated protease RseP (regulator of RpoE activity)